MNEKQIFILVILAVMFVAFIVIANMLDSKSINGIKAKTVGDGQYGTARWATKAEIKSAFSLLPFESEKWRKGKDLPTVQGTIVGCRGHRKTVALVDTGDVHTLMIGAAGVGKTAYFLYPNIEFACASGMSFLSTDTKGDVARNYGNIAKKYYGYNVSVLDLRNPTRSDENNILHLVNKYMDEYLADKRNLSAKAKSEKYAKITAKTIINIGGGDSASYGQNAFFYDAAEGLLASVILLLAEFGEKNERHIVSVFKLIQDLIAKPPPKSKTDKPPMYFTKLMDKLPGDHKAKWFAGAALNSSDQAMMSVLSTAYYTGDGGYYDVFERVYKELGEIDLMMADSGQYDKGWATTHMNPNETVQAAKDAHAKWLIPVHWGAFVLANHAWDEPPQMAVEAAERRNVNIATPKIGETVDYDNIENFTEHWWEDID